MPTQVRVLASSLLKSLSSTQEIANGVCSSSKGDAELNARASIAEHAELNTCCSALSERPTGLKVGAQLEVGEQLVIVEYT